MRIKTGSIAVGFNRRIMGEKNRINYRQLQLEKTGSITVSFSWKRQDQLPSASAEKNSINYRQLQLKKTVSITVSFS